MKIIDAHLHIFPSEPGTDAMARGVGHENSVEHLRQVYGELEIVHGVVMGNRSWCSAGGATSRRTCPTRWRSI